MLVRYRTIPSLFSEIDQILNQNFSIPQRLQGFESARGLSVKESGEAVTVIAELPGVAKDDVKVTLHDGVLTIASERKQPVLKENEQWVRNEISYGKSERTITLPYPVVSDKISARHENGILTVVLPKAEEAKPKQISIH